MLSKVAVYIILAILVVLIVFGLFIFLDKRTTVEQQPVGQEYISEKFGYSFYYPEEYSVIESLEDLDNLQKYSGSLPKGLSTIVVLPISMKGNPSDNLGFVTITIQKKEAGTLLDWAKSYSHDISRYEKDIVGGEEALVHRDEYTKQINQALFYSPDGQWRISIATQNSSGGWGFTGWPSSNLTAAFQKVTGSFNFKVRGM